MKLISKLAAAALLLAAPGALPLHAQEEGLEAKTGIKRNAVDLLPIYSSLLWMSLINTTNNPSDVDIYLIGAGYGHAFTDHLVLFGQGAALFSPQSPDVYYYDGRASLRYYTAGRPFQGFYVGGTAGYWNFTLWELKLSAAIATGILGGTWQLGALYLETEFGLGAAFGNIQLFSADISHAYLLPTFQLRSGIVF
ncbi:MAG: hypothetical protein LBR16_00135 [Treponema sp.]|jgi:hypothetical protein|nr:hypothetical protein [Treponema sp.]